MQGGSGSIPSQGTSSLMLQLKIGHAARSHTQQERSCMLQLRPRAAKKKKSSSFCLALSGHLPWNQLLCCVGSQTSCRGSSKEDWKASAESQHQLPDAWMSKFYMAPLPRPGLFQLKSQTQSPCFPLCPVWIHDQSPHPQTTRDNNKWLFKLLNFGEIKKIVIDN